MPRRVSSGLPGLDQLLGGGLVAGSVVLVSGEPGIGKSSLGLALCRSSDWMVISSEETLSQLATRARRLGLDGAIKALATRELDEAIAELNATEARFVVVDSLHALAASQQGLREATDRLVRVAKQRELTMVVIGQVAKDGDPLGPRYVEHMVDVSLMVEAAGVPGVRRVVVRKNRFGPSDGLRRFALGEAGVEELEEERALPSVLHPGQTFAAILVGGRPCLVEIDAMVGPRGRSRLLVQGMSTERVRYVSAVIEKHLGLPLPEHEVMVSVPDGLVAADPGADLALAAALVGSLQDRALARPIALAGELGLLGEVRPAGDLVVRRRALSLSSSQLVAPVGTRLVTALASLGLIEAPQLRVVG